MLRVAVPPLLLAAGAYVVLVRRLAGAWPRTRTAAFLAGVTVIGVALLSPLAGAEGESFPAHVGQHLLLGFAAPVLLALGAPVALALRAGPRRAVGSALRSRAVRLLTAPPIGAALYVGSPFVLYFTGLYAASERLPLLHAAVHLHFVAVGCLFYWPVLGVDPQRRRISPPLRMLLAFVVLAFHAFLGVALLSSTDAQRRAGGGLMWAGGDLLGLVVLGIVLAQWFRSDDLTAAREDRALDGVVVGP
jgi:putative copper resistance protein D